MSTSVVFAAPVTSPLDGEVLTSISGDDLTACRFSTAIVGGYAGATIGIRPGRLRATTLPYFAHSVIVVDGSPVYEGQFSEPEEKAGWITGAPLEGYYFTALEDHTYTSTAAGTISGGTLLASVLDSAAPRLVRGNGEQWSDSAGAWVASDYDSIMPSVVFNAVSKAGHPSGSPLDYRVWDGRVVWGVARIPPDVPDYVVGFHDPGLTRKRSAKGTYGALSLRYTTDTSGTGSITAGNTSVTINHLLGTTPLASDIKLTPTGYGGAQNMKVQNLTSSTFDVVLDVAATGTATFGWEATHKDTTARFSDGTYTDRMGINRNVQIAGGSMPNPVATAFAEAELAKRAYPTVSTSVRRTGWEGLRTPAGGETPPHLVRAGQWLWVESDDAMLPIVATTFDALTGTLDVSCGVPMPSLHETLRQLRDGDALAKAGVHANTGSLER